MKPLLFIILLSTHIFAIEAVNFSARFGGAFVDSEDVETEGTGFTIQSELFLNNQYGILLAYGNTSTVSDSEVNILGGARRSELSLENSYFQSGLFYYVLPGLRASVGLTFHSVDIEENTAGAATNESSENFTGFYGSLGYAHAFGPIILGAEYSMIRFDEYDQSGLFLIIGLLI